MNSTQAHCTGVDQVCIVYRIVKSC